MVAFLRRFDLALARVEEIFLASALAVMALVVFCDFAFRELFNSGWLWAKELAAFLMVWVGFIGGSLATHRGRHLVVRAGERFFPPRLHRFTLPVSCFITAALSFGLAWLGIGYVVETRAMGETSLILGIPLWLVQAVIPLSFALVGLRFLGSGLQILPSARSDDAEGKVVPAGDPEGAAS